MKNSVKQVRVTLEEISTVLHEFEDELFSEFNFKNSEYHSCEIQHRGIGINFAFDEEIHRSDDEILYYLKDDRLLGCLIIRRTSFNNAEITMIKTEERYPDNEPFKPFRK
jgi:hypothetical protein